MNETNIDNVRLFSTAPGHGVDPVLGLLPHHPEHVGAVGGELPPQEGVNQEDVPHHVHQVEQLAEEQPGRPGVVGVEVLGEVVGQELRVDVEWDETTTLCLSCLSSLSPRRLDFWCRQDITASTWCNIHGCFWCMFSPTFPPSASLKRA